MILAHKIELIPNNRQKTYLSKSCGTARFAYNWALSQWEKQYQAGEKPNEAALRRQLNSIKRKDYPWMMEVTKNAPQMAIIQLGLAFKNFFAKRSGYPRFRKKGADDCFTVTNDQFYVNDSRIHIPKLGWVRMRESLRFKGKIVSATISKRSDKWFVSISVETVINDTACAANDNQVAVGVDIGISVFATLSTGEKVFGPKPYKAVIDKIKRLSRSLSRKIKGSKNREKAKLKLSRLHRRIANVRMDTIHQLTSRLVNEFQIIGIETLNIKGMMKNHRLARSIADMGWHEFKRQLDYKSQLTGTKVIMADRWFASTKICSNSRCHYKHDQLDISQREWTCPSCLTHHDRDINSAINLENVAVSSTVSACGASSSGVVAASAITSYGVMKQESSIIHA